jgi:hypothetical protein
MNIHEQNHSLPHQYNQPEQNFKSLKFEHRRFSRYKIKRRVLLKDKENRVYSGLAYDISRRGLLLRCSSPVAYELLYKSNHMDLMNPNAYEIKIALPYMNRLTECRIFCKITSHQRINNQYARIGLNFQLIDDDSQERLNHFLNNLSD